MIYSYLFFTPHDRRTGVRMVLRGGSWAQARSPRTSVAVSMLYTSHQVYAETLPLLYDRIIFCFHSVNEFLEYLPRFPSRLRLFVGIVPRVWPAKPDGVDAPLQVSEEVWRHLERVNIRACNLVCDLRQMDHRIDEIHLFFSHWAAMDRVRLWHIHSQKPVMLDLFRIIRDVGGKAIMKAQGKWDYSFFKE